MLPTCLNRILTKSELASRLGHLLVGWHKDEASNLWLSLSLCRNSPLTQEMKWGLSMLSASQKQEAMRLKPRMASVNEISLSFHPLNCMVMLNTLNYQFMNGGGGLFRRKWRSVSLLPTRQSLDHVNLQATVSQYQFPFWVDGQRHKQDTTGHDGHCSLISQYYLVIFYLDKHQLLHVLLWQIRASFHMEIGGYILNVTKYGVVIRHDVWMKEIWLTQSVLILMNSA